MIEISGKTAMLAKAGDPDSIVGAVMEPKLDGHRMLAKVRESGVRMYARTGVDKTGKCPQIEDALREYPDGIYDGEIVSADWQTKGGDWAKVQNILGANAGRSNQLVFVVFDVLELMGEDVRLHSLAARRGLLERIFESMSDGLAEDYPLPVVLIEQSQYDAEAVAQAMADGWEGAIIKDPAGIYLSGKRGWVKVKATETEDVVIMGATPGKGRFANSIGALRFGQYLDGELVELGQCSGMNDAMRAEFAQRWATGWLEGGVIEVQHMGKMPSGGWRHPQFKRVRTDKLAEDCIGS